MQRLAKASIESLRIRATSAGQEVRRLSGATSRRLSLLSMLGTILGVLLIGVINNGLTLHNVEPFWVQFIQGSVIFLAVLFDSLNQKRRGA
jgi:ribose/xylose/arabinose/galactoside ABC-type transport system permease subunit